MHGWVYVISNKSMPGLVKVGYSMKTPDLRASELNHTGSPHPYVVDYSLLVDEPRNVEQTVHRHLADQLEGKEWFRCSVETAVAAIKNIVGSNVAPSECYRHADKESAERSTLGKRDADIAAVAQDTRPHVSGPLTNALAENQTRRNYHGQMEYICPYCEHKTTQPDSHIGRCGYCRRTGFIPYR